VRVSCHWREGLRTEPHISRLAMLSIVLMRVIYDPSTRTVSGSSRGSPAEVSAPRLHGFSPRGCPAESSRGIPSCVSRVIRETRVRNADAKSWRSFDGAAMWRWKLDGGGLTGRRASSTDQHGPEGGEELSPRENDSGLSLRENGSEILPCRGRIDYVT